MARSAQVFVVAFIGLVSLAVSALAATPIGKVVAVVGSPTGSGRALSAGSDIFENDKVVTGKGNVQILFVDNTKLVVGPNSTLVVDRFLMRGGNSAQKFSVNALRGTFRFITGSMAKNAYDIKAGNATIGIRGTAFDFSSGAETLLAVLEGSVRFCAAGDCEIVPDNCGVARANRRNVDALGGRAKGRALRTLPYILNQGTLNRAFRLNTTSCRSSMSLLPTAPNGSQGKTGSGPSGSSPAGGSSGGGTPGGGENPGGGDPGGGTPGNGGGGSGTGGGPSRGNL